MEKGILKKLICIACFVFLWASAVIAAEPEPPVVNTPFDSETEAEIAGLTSIPTDQVYAKLGDKKFFSNDKLLYKAIFAAFGQRKKDVLDFVTQSFSSPVVEKVNGSLVNKYRDFAISKKVLEVFPSEAAGPLAQLYKNGDPVMKRNVINAAGKVTGQTIRKLLIEALDDATVSGEIYPEQQGEPLRICDYAYNQIVLRYKPRNVLRTIGSVYDVEVRDYHIDILKGLIGKGKV